MIAKAMKQAGELALFDHGDTDLQLIVKDDAGTPEGAKAAAEGISDNEMTERTVATTSLRMLIPQQDIANMALYLASPFGAAISGQAISVDGDMQYMM